MEETVLELVRVHTALSIAPKMDHSDPVEIARVTRYHDSQIKASHQLIMLALDRGVAENLAGLHRGLRARTGLSDKVIDQALSDVVGWVAESEADKPTDTWDP